MGMYTLHKGFWEDKHIFSGFYSGVMWPQQFMSWFGHRGCLAGHQTTWVDLPCCFWLDLKLQVDFTSLAILTKLYILGAENTVLKYGGSQGQNPKSADPFSLWC